MRTAFDPDGSEHGTHVAGIAAGLSGITGTSLGVTISGLSGVAPHAYIGSYRVLTTPTPSFGLDGNGPEIARAIDKAVADGMDVLNLSLGEPEVEASNDLVARAIHGAAKAGVVTVVAAGNSGDDLGGGSVSSPGSAPDAITVAATSVGRFVGVKLGVLGPGTVPADLAAFGAATDEPDQIPDAWKAGVPLVVSPTCGGGRAGALVLVQLGPLCTSAHADAAIAPGSLGIVYAQRAAGDPTAVDDSQQRSLTVSDLIGARLAQQATAAARRADALGRRRARRAGLRELGPDRLLLVARPRAVLARAQAGRRGAGRRHRLADPGRLRHLVGHEHGLARGRGRSGAAASAAPRLDAGADQVGARAHGAARLQRHRPQAPDERARGRRRHDRRAGGGRPRALRGAVRRVVRAAAAEPPRDPLARAHRRRRRRGHLVGQRTRPRRSPRRSRSRPAAGRSSSSR